MTLTYVLIGGGLASAFAAEAIRGRDADGHIVLVTGEGEYPYNRPDLSKGYLLGTRPVEKLFYKAKGFADAATFYTERGVQVVRGDPAVRVDAAARTVKLSSGTVLSYDRLLLATGGRARPLPLPGAQLEGVHYLRSLADADALLADVTGAKQAVVIGGGFIGAEAAAALAQRGLAVTVVLRESALMRRALGDAGAEALTEYFRTKGVTIITSDSPQVLEGDTRVKAVHLESGRVLPADLVLVGVGIALNTVLAEQVGLALDPHLGGGVITDAYLRTQRPEIYAAGDIAAFDSVRYGRRMRIEHWDHARRSGRAAGANMAGAHEPYNALPYFYSDVFDLDLQAHGDLYQWDTVIQRGSFAAAEKPALVLFYLFQNALRGVLALNPPEHFFDALEPALAAQRVLTAEEQARLADLSVAPLA